MSNPVIVIGNTIPTPDDPQVERRTFSRIDYSEQKFFLHAENEYDPFYTLFNPEGKGKEFFIFIPLDNALSAAGVPPGTKPSFVAQTPWTDGVRLASSGFLTTVNSIMPKLIVPSQDLVDNGLDSQNFTTGGAARGKMWAYDRSGSFDMFNWRIVSFQGGAPPVADYFDYFQTGGYAGSRYVSCKAKEDTTAINSLVLELNPPPNSLPDTDWQGDLVIGGAFCLLVNLVPHRSASASPDEIQENPWHMKFEFGDVVMELGETGALKVQLINAQDNTYTVNLAQGKSKEGPPQQQHIDDKQPFVILVYPVWNGVIVADGVQESNETVYTSSTYVPKLKEPSIYEPPYSNGFDPTNPADVEVGVGALLTNVLVDFGNKMTVTAENCRFELAYLPVYFSRRCWFDEWFVQSDDIPGTVKYSYNVYPIWTKNGTNYSLNPVPDANKTNFDGPFDDTSYYYIPWRLQNTKFARFSGEIFGSVLEINETRDFPVKNGNGNFNLSWTGGTPGDPSPLSNWWNYVTNISVSVSIDGSSGNLTVDKYGLAGQDAEAIQKIGALTINASGGFGTFGGSIFQGLALGVADQMSADGATWSINLIGLEKKMDDIALINVPFLDGYIASTALTFLANYAGIISDFSNAPWAAFGRLGVSDEPNIPRFDWKTGTTVRAALDEVMTDIAYHYVVRDGKIYFYELDGFTGLPIFLGPNWAGSYPNTKVMNIDKTPDFEDLRNEVVVIGLQADYGGQGAKISAVPTFPLYKAISQNTDPDLPWAKSWAYMLPGYFSTDELNRMATNIANQEGVRSYELTGRVSIPGNANIKPYDRWDEFVIYSVGHNIDLVSKSWTTDLELMRSAASV